MSWFTKLNSHTIHPESAYGLTPTMEKDFYFTVTSQDQYHEWKYLNTIPKGTKFIETLPTREVILDDKVIIAAKPPRSAFSTIDGHLVLDNDISGGFYIKSGGIKTAEELLDQYRHKRSYLKRKQELFKSSCSVNLFLKTCEKEPRIYRIIHFNNDLVKLENYGLFSELQKKIEGGVKRVFAEIKNKSGKANELSEIFRHEIFMAYLNTVSALDTAKLDFILKQAEIKPTEHKDLSWNDLYLSTSSEARSISQDISNFLSYSWVKQYVF